MTVYISIGNSDDKLSQKQWSGFVSMIDLLVRARADAVHGYWLSEPSSEYQNACWCIELPGGQWRTDLKEALAHYARQFNQDSIAWAEVKETEFL